MGDEGELDEPLHITCNHGTPPPPPLPLSTTFQHTLSIHPLACNHRTMNPILNDTHTHLIYTPLLKARLSYPTLPYPYPNPPNIERHIHTPTNTPLSPIYLPTHFHYTPHLYTPLLKATQRRPRLSYPTLLTHLAPLYTFLYTSPTHIIYTLNY